MQSWGRQPRVVVVGAGFAGVAAARHLRQGGLDDVILLEARDRPGGRVETVQLEKGFLELGAQFLHGETELFDFVKSHGCLRDLGEYEEEEVPDTLILYQTYTFRSPGGTALKKKVVQHNLQVLEELIDQALEAGKEGPKNVLDPSVSVADYLHSVYPQCLQRMTGDPADKAAMIKWLEDWFIMDCAGTVRDLSLVGQGRYVYEEGSGVRETRAGMWDVLSRMLQEALPKDRVLLSKPVKAVHWRGEGHTDPTAAVGNSSDGNNNNNNNDEIADRNDPGTRMALNVDAERSDRLSPTSECDSNLGMSSNSALGPTIPQKSEASSTSPVPSPASSPEKKKVTIHCEDGDVIMADHVIVTSSIGYLKEHRDFFVPPLPPKHREAVERTGFGDVSKVFLIWDKPQAESASPGKKKTGKLKWLRQVFGIEKDGMALLWPDSPLPDFPSAKSDQRSSDGRHWYEYISLIEFIDSYNHCLVVWIGGEGAVIMESLPESEVKDVSYEVLTEFLGKKALPPPSRIVRSQWFTNPYTRGAYSYLATGVPVELQDVLTKPLPSLQTPVLQLAGEACSRSYYSTAHGAMQSGQQAAATILRHYNMAPLQQGSLDKAPPSVQLNAQNQC